MDNIDPKLAKEIEDNQARFEERYANDKEYKEKMDNCFAILDKMLGFALEEHALKSQRKNL